MLPVAAALITGTSGGMHETLSVRGNVLLRAVRGLCSKRHPAEKVKVCEDSKKALMATIWSRTGMRNDHWQFECFSFGLQVHGAARLHLIEAIVVDRFLPVGMFND